jgi:putative glycerol-1-phosphate prenyltransferase
VDPDKNSDQHCGRLLKVCEAAEVDFLLVGGSLIANGSQSTTIRNIKALSHIPVILFPGNSMYLEDHVDAVFFLSLISGRNPEYLIGQHVIAAPFLKARDIEVLPTGYMLVGDSDKTSVAYMSNTSPIPNEKYDIAACTAMAGEMLGLRLIYLDAGSGAHHPVSKRMIREVRRAVDVPLIVGGGINSVEKAYDAYMSGAELIVIGNGAEDNTELIREVARLTKTLNRELDVHK